MNKIVAVTRISSLVCPTEPDPLTTPAAPFTPGQTSYAACHHDVAHRRGTERGHVPEQPGLPADIPDGTSSTIMIGAVHRGEPG
ncbi:MAG: hypothetical protein U0835_18930 [Isosphaeraceae bacterium]